jgi:hypothetical protein
MTTDSTVEIVDNLINLNMRRKKTREAVNLEDFVAYLPMHTYYFMPTREPWPASSVNVRVPPLGTRTRDKDGKEKLILASAWLDQNRSAEQMTWAPGEGDLIHDRLISDGGWIERGGATCLNLYRPPKLTLGIAAEANPWRDHVAMVYPDDHEHIIRWLAHRVQHPEIKTNHALVLGGAQGIGKDTLLEPVKRAVGPWNFSEVSPQNMFGRFNGYIQSVILRISEARDLGDVDRYQFYERLKAYTAAPPDVLRVDEKFLREHSVLNCCGVIITTNHKSDGIYLPADDRRHFVAWSTRTKEDFPDNYWVGLWSWYNNGGDSHVVAYLAELDLSEFDPKAPPPKTAAFFDIVDNNRAPEDAELADALDALRWPDAVTLAQISTVVAADFGLWLADRKNRRSIPHRLERCGYARARNGDAEDGLWKIGNRRQAVYAKSNLSVRNQHAVAAKLAEQGWRHHP